MRKVIIVQKIFPEYRKPIFDAIHQKVNFALLHSTNTSGIKQTTSVYSVRVKKLQYGKGETHLFLNVFGYLMKNKPKIVIHELAVGIISLPLVLFAKRVFGYKLILWGHMYNRKAGFNPQKSLSDKYRLWMQKNANAIITYSLREKEELVQHGINADKVFPALNTLNTNKYLPVRDKLGKTGKDSIKQELGFTHQYNLIFIGRLYADKWPQIALEVLHHILKTKPFSVALHFVGSGAMEKQLMEFAYKHSLQSNVFFHGDIYDEITTGQLLFASDMMIMPGCVGLSVNHAFCFDCPVITFKSVDHVPAHGPEIEYIIHGQTGFIVEDRSVAKMAETICEYLNSDEKQASVKVNIRNLIENICPIEKLTNGFIDAINYLNQNSN